MLCNSNDITRTHDGVALHDNIAVAVTVVGKTYTRHSATYTVRRTVYVQGPYMEVYDESSFNRDLTYVIPFQTNIYKTIMVNL